MLQEALCCYTADTLIDIDTVKEFCEQSSKWILKREKEVDMMKDIKTRADNIDLSIGHVTQSQTRGKAFLQYMKSKVTQGTADRRRAELEEELAALLKSTLEGLEELDCFLDAVENLAVTSLPLFMEENQVLHLPEGISPVTNVEVLAYQLDKYIRTTQQICEKLEKSSFCDFCLKMNDDTLVDLGVDLSEDDTQRMVHHINQLDELRQNQSFRMVFLFQDEPCSGFIDEFKERQPRMEQSLKDLEEHAVQLDRMNKGAKISSVAGSSVGAVGGVLYIVGLALSPVTSGVSLVLTMTGVGMGITSGVNSAVTTATEIGVKHTYQKKAREVLQSFMEDVQCLQDCLEEVTKRQTRLIDIRGGVGKVIWKACTIAKGIDSFVDAASVFKLLKSEELALSADIVAVQEGEALCNVPRVAEVIPDVGQAAFKEPLALSKSARLTCVINALFFGMDIFYIFKDSISLARGNETEFSQFIRARAALWRSEVDSMQTIHDLLCEGLKISEENKAILKRQFFR
ncbi:Apolipoprotein L3 [Dissostichus eleginoides]|uniref:Apolipoprotein L3 n=1 Tax=Dissostichus eleginoides TaxID=100907 RepID=A0AAD9EQE0_DISEL|nr:Apolipoprotein L3 [Dissostichus eleginoides]